MINLDLVRLINSGTAWAFVGSGVSADAGLPDWRQLLHDCISELEKKQPLTSTTHDRIKRDGANLPACFQALCDQFTKAALDQVVAATLGRVTRPGKLHSLLADWPFQAYVTPNFELLLDQALKAKYAGWTSVGNSAAESKKIAKGVEHIIWHPHGGFGLAEKNSRFVLGTNDYDEVYPSGSPVKSALESAFRMCRFVIVGFGFKDPDLRELLQRIARITIPGKPAYAFLGDTTQQDRDDLKYSYNIEVIPYDVIADDHSQLSRTLDLYRTFIITRDIQLGPASIADVGYDPTVTSLLVQNRIASQTLDVSIEAHEAIMRASVLHTLGSGAKSATDLQAAALGMPKTAPFLQSAVATLITKNIISRSGDQLALTKEGRNLLGEGQAAAELKRDQFIAALRLRIDKHCSDKAAERVQLVAVQFLEDITRERGLGVAQNLAGVTANQLRHRVVALIQELPNYFSKCESRKETECLVEAVTGVLSSPSNHEREYLGIRTQAYFGRHVAGFDVASLAIRQQSLSQAVFIADSHFLITLLARGCTGHEFSQQLLRLLTTSGALFVATDLLLIETIEHAEYAAKLIRDHGPNSVAVLDAARGSGGRKSNAFLEGFVNQQRIRTHDRFPAYLAEVCGTKPTGRSVQQLIREAVKTCGIVVTAHQQWPGWKLEFCGDLPELEVEIKKRRSTNHTFKHDRQVEAEAEIVMLLAKIRQGVLKIPGHNTLTGFFLSDSRIIEGIDGFPKRLCITPEALFQWLLSVRTVTDEQASAIFDQLLSELAQSGVKIISHEGIARAFSGVIEASKSGLSRVIEDHRDTIYDIYGVDPATAFSGIDDLELPDAMERINIDVLTRTREMLVEEKKKRHSAEKEIAELEDLRKYASKRAKARQKAKKRAAAARSKPQSKRKKKKSHGKKG